MNDNTEELMEAVLSGTVTEEQRPEIARRIATDAEFRRESRKRGRQGAGKRKNWRGEGQAG